MAELGCMLASAILKVVGQQIGSAIEGQITLQQDFHNDLKKMKMALESVEAVLDDAEARSITDRSTCLWLKRLKVAMYAISDMIDEFEADTQAIAPPSKGKFSMKNYLAVMIPCLTIGPKVTLANKMKTMRVDLDEITGQHMKFNLLASTNATELKVLDKLETSSNMYAQIFGRTEERDTILASLSKFMTKEITILPIYGIGGLGKTTLAQMVYSSSQFKDYSRVWVYVSQTFELKKIGNSIISQLSEKESHYTEMQMIEKTLSKLFDDKKILIVLDDLWQDKKIELDRLKGMLNVGNESNVVVIVTTRSESIAMEVSTIQPHKLALLSNDMCWSIIKHKSSFESRDDKHELQPIGKDIANKCGGVALAAQSLGYVLRSMTRPQWELMRDNDIWSISDSKTPAFTDVIASLRLSYRVMPPYLKLCFAYCAIFPKGHKIVKDDLIQQWIALDFIEPNDVYSSSELGEIYIGQLLGLSFLRNSESPLVAGVHLEDATMFTMHDLVHDLARSVMVDEIHVPGKKENTGESSVRYALLNDCSKPLESFKTRALHFVDCCGIELDGAAFSSAKSLRVLDLSECSIQKLPDSIGLLKQLRYLSAPRVQDAMIPNTITRLSKLTYLNLHGSSAISALPESIGDIESLLYIDLSGCSKIEKLPDSLGRLKKLVHLDLSNCSRVRGVSVFLGCLKELQHLNLSNCPYIGDLPRALGGLTKLQYLNLSCQEYKNNLCLIGLPEVIGNLSELHYLNLSWCMTCMFETYRGRIARYQLGGFMDHLSTLSNLKHLDFSNNNGIRELPENICKLRKLHALDLSGCFYLKRIPESIGTMDGLKFLNLNGCPKVCDIPLGASVISLPRFVVRVGDGSSGSNLVLLQHTNPHRLEITDLENAKSAEEAHSIKLLEKQRLEYLELEWTRDAERFVDDQMLLEKLVPPSTLKMLDIGGYNGVNFPAWLMGTKDYLPNLVTMRMCYMPKCKCVPPIGNLPHLEELSLTDMESLEEWNTLYSSGEEYVLESLTIIDCPNLRMKPLPPRAKRWLISGSDSVLSSWEECTMTHAGASPSFSLMTTDLEVNNCKIPLHQWNLLYHLPGLTSLSIQHCGDLTSSQQIIGPLASVRTLFLEHEDHNELPEWLGELPSLQSLKISRYPRVTELCENMRRLTMLRSLCLYRCNSMTSLPHWLAELTSLEKLNIQDCKGIRSLPESIHQLTSLQQLKINYCPYLREWCESEENKMKIAHIKEKDIS